MVVRVQASLGRRSTCRSTGPVYGNDHVQDSAAPRLGPQNAPKQGTRQGKSSGGQLVRSNHRICRSQERATYMDLPYVIIFTIASVLTLYPCTNYLHAWFSIATRMHHIEKMEAELEQLRAKNDVLETSVNISIDLNEIYEIATRELGMMYAKKDQMLLYDKAESEYVRQYEDISEH